MRRTTIVAPDQLLDQIRQAAAERGTSMAVIIREALEDKLRSHRRRPRSLGIGASGRSDTARQTAIEPPVPRPWR